MPYHYTNYNAERDTMMLVLANLIERVNVDIDFFFVSDMDWVFLLGLAGSFSFVILFNVIMLFLHNF